MPRSARSTTTRSGRPPARVPGASRPAIASDAPRLDLKAMRIYHVTHIDNLPPILDAGALLADAAGAAPVVDLAAPHAREYRRTAAIADTDAVVADYVPFLLTTDAHVWEAVRTATPDPRLHDDAVKRAPSDFVIFVSSLASAQAGDPETPGTIVVSEADAAVAGATVATEWSDVQRLLQRLYREDDGSGLDGAELLVRECLPLDSVALIAVANDPVRDRVRAALAGAGVRARVAVYPPWFQPTADAAAE
ncbi:DarT ssDNA thymidine ADP-ribosyltransferase family protein [Agromyces badenianii]|uniref:DarT ssDNA thymidine ADP-ribosyltransferase family protein n=1 Tax=Agromyces badenianii TaxID=2080742 RepID=UPI00105A212C|nr:DarT ssDNA thymidine ADP-ribosyltransferase family protein [Agromyces badenianii]